MNQDFFYQIISNYAQVEKYSNKHDGKKNKRVTAKNPNQNKNCLWARKSKKQ